MAYSTSTFGFQPLDDRLKAPRTPYTMTQQAPAPAPTPVSTRPTTSPTVSVPKTGTMVQQPMIQSEGAGLLTGLQPQVQQAPAAPASHPGFTDLRSTTITPQQSAGTQQAGNLASNIGYRLGSNQLPGWSGVNPNNLGQAQGLAQATANGTDTNQVRNMVLQALQQAQSPDRVQLALQTFQNLRRASDPYYQQDLRAVGQKNAALGRLGSGMVTNQLMDVTAQRERDLAQAQSQLAADAAGNTLSDRLASLNATGGILGLLGGEGRANAGLAAQLAGQQYGQQAGERNAQLDYGLSSRASDLGVMQGLQGLQGQYFNQDLANQNALRGERDYQSAQAQQAIANALQQRLSEDTLQNSATSRYLQQLQAFGGLGYGGLPTGSMLNAADQYGQQGAAGMQSLGDLYAGQSYLDWLKQNGAQF